MCSLLGLFCPLFAGLLLVVVLLLRFVLSIDLRQGRLGKRLELDELFLRRPVHAAILPVLLLEQVQELLEYLGCFLIIFKMLLHLP